jgi:enoyl-CoA hydratase/carnithine racemase
MTVSPQEEKDANDRALVGVERLDHVTVVTMQRPEKRNALNAALIRQLQHAFDIFEADADQRCAVLTGDGVAFCAGADLKEMADLRRAVMPPELRHVLGSSGSLTKPVIAAVNGPAVAGGFYVAQSCDLVVAAESATFGITEALRGRGSPWATPLIGMVSSRIMMELLLTGEAISAQRAHAVGLVNTVVPDVDLRSAAIAMAEKIARNAPLTVQAGKRLVSLAAALGPQVSREPADWLYYPVYTSEDAQEGPRAFAEKRDPVWKGR